MVIKGAGEDGGKGGIPILYLVLDKDDQTKGVSRGSLPKGTPDWLELGGWLPSLAPKGTWPGKV